MNIQKKKIRDFLLKSQPIVLITTGRTGSDLFQSLLDSHTQVLTFNGHFGFYAFWRSTELMRKNSNCMVEDIAYKFVSNNIHQLKSYFDQHERKHMLGDDRDESLIIDINAFVRSVCSFLLDVELSSRNFLFAIYTAYSEVLGHDLLKKRVLFHHMHHTRELGDFIKDFPKTKIISMTRDPRSNYYSGIYHRMRWYKTHKLKNKVMTSNAIYEYLQRIFIDSDALKKYRCPYVSIRIEDLGRRDILQRASHWMGIDYEDSMKKSTWGGLNWSGDALSPKFNTKSGFSSEMINNNWSENLPYIDKFIINIVLNSRLKHYGYNYNNISAIDMFIAPFVILLPIGFEYKSFFTRVTMWQFIRAFRLHIIGYFKRIVLFYKYYFRELMGVKFNGPYIS